ncbi:primosomal protein N' [Pseudoalteromonas tunicata]|uniref:Replication restart protein PriA n=1 Tax=Pseudoalteromonas tunicata D2 TaxID=87626 RepID=A4C8F8_9GAMM|nr:primosomal protein N' [Pseudoalteromonas tunicata]ATC93377.1 primosomal protein N' (replication factor Y) (superfamily II helicase) [Pseudoalteromonas tunicata]AXT32424.1 primosomal protein N' [Pseudoalteromonas tunicata]EAR28873.1 Primosome factor Y, protein n' [Pseudoalteromonas tunicata D2]MDP5213555.1 primosomal protein N' [Pseudoalteromonas tunicata]
MKIVEVAIKVPLNRTFDYLVPEALCTTICSGMRVEVNFANQKKIGIVLGVKDHSDFAIEKLKPITTLLDTTPVFQNDILNLLKFASQYYCFPLGETLQLALPTLLRQGKSPDKTSVVYLDLTRDGQAITTLRGAKQLALVKQLQASGKTPLTEIKALGFASATIKALLKQQLIHEFVEHDNCWQTAELTINKALKLNPEQAIACAAIKQNKGYQTYLLEGITGSGKTEVYLQALADVLAKGKQALVLVPEIGLTPQTVNRFRRRFPNTPIMLWHSALTDSERLQTWRYCEQGSCAIVIGTRSAIFTPFAQLGMIIVDEEHDSSFKQQDSLRYHARDLAVYRAHQAKIPLILGTATPALETLHKALNGKYQLLTLNQRAQTATNNQYCLIDMRGQQEQAGIAQASLAVIKQHLAKQKQVMIFLNRRGFSPTLICHECGWLSNCKRCSTSATYHKGIRSLICHHCGEHERPPMQCPDCGSTQIFPAGKGTEQVEDFLTEQFTDIPINRIDRDTTRRKGSLEEALEEINTPGARILIGTQMLAKGHHFPDVSLVVILDVDSGLYSFDFRATEHLAQLITQVSGRAGRSGEAGVVLLQTHFPEHPLLQDLINNGYQDFARFALTERQLTSFPPFSQLALIRAQAHDAKLVQAFLNDLIPKTPIAGIELLGPLPAPLEKIAGQYRYQLHLQAQNRSQLHQYLVQLVEYLNSSKLAAKVRWHIDVDPIDMN